MQLGRGTPAAPHTPNILYGSEACLTPPPPPPPLSPAHSPIAMYNKVHSPPLWQRTIMGTVNVVCFVVSVLAVVGSAYNIAEDASTYKMFGGRR